MCARIFCFAELAAAGVPIFAFLPEYYDTDAFMAAIGAALPGVGNDAELAFQAVMAQSLLEADWVSIPYDLSMIGKGDMTLYAPIYETSAA